MEKVIEINGKTLKLKSSLNTIIAYKETFGNEIFEDIAKVEKVDDKNVTSVIEVIFRILYILTEPSKLDNFNDFLKNFEITVLSDQKVISLLSNTIVELLRADAKGEKKEETFR